MMLPARRILTPSISREAEDVLKAERVGLPPLLVGARTYNAALAGVGIAHCVVAGLAIAVVGSLVGNMLLALL